MLGGLALDQRRERELAMGEVFMGRAVRRTSPAQPSRSRSKLASAMREVHEDIPSTVERADVAGERKEAMLRAIAFSKARKAGARLPRKGK